MSNGDLIIHAGTAKTGTTSLHYALYKLAPWLLSNGVNYPNLNGSGFGWTAERGRSAGNADPEYPGYQWESDDWVERFQWMLDRASELADSKEKIVLTSELLSVLTTREEFWTRLKSFQQESGRRISLVLYLRDPFSMFVSCYQQSVKIEGFHGEASDFVSEFMNVNRVPRFYTQSNIDRVSEFAKLNDIHLVLFRYEDSLPNLELHFFKELLDLEVPPSRYVPKRFNLSMSSIEIDFHRGVNSVDPNLGQTFGYERLDTFLAQFTRKFTSSYKMFLSNDDIDTLHHMFQLYQAKTEKYVYFHDRIDYSVNLGMLEKAMNPDVVQLRSEIFELGRFVALSYTSGYLDWTIKRKYQSTQDE